MLKVSLLTGVVIIDATVVKGNGSPHLYKFHWQRDPALAYSPGVATET
jgi:hypothetical protein